MNEHRSMKDSWDNSADHSPPAEAEVKSGVTLPKKVSELRWKLGRKAKQQRLRMPETESFQESRMRETRTSGLRRGRAPATPVPSYSTGLTTSLRVNLVLRGRAYQS